MDRLAVQQFIDQKWMDEIVPELVEEAEKAYESDAPKAGKE